MADRPTWVGKTIGGRYRIDDILGQGGMSAVYKAYDPNLRRVVAIKLIHSHLADDPRFLTRFTEEATAVAQLRHQNIVQVFDFEHDGDLYYMVQEFIPGETLQQRLRRMEKSGRLMPLKDAIRYTIQIANASGYAHLRGMIHRDIKPANIMINVQDQATLMDFGIVKITGGESHTATGAVVGTALYLSPELIRGETPDTRADIYSLGVTLFEMVSGRPPFEADSAMTLMMMHMNDPVPDLRQIRDGVPESLVAVIERAMQKNRLDRYASMEEMADDLERALQTLPDVQPATQIEPPPVQKETSPPKDAPVVTRAFAEAPPETLDAQPPPPPSPTPPQPPPPQPPSLPVSDAGRKPVPLPVWIGIGLAAVILAAIGIFQVSRGRSQPGQAVETQASATHTVQAVALEPATDTPAPTDTLAPTETPTPPATSTPTATPTLGLPATPTFPAGMPFAFIESITLDENERYIVEYDTLEFQEVLPGVHVHFFFDTVAPEQAGSPGHGPWILWGGPRPFTEYRKRDHSAQATQMCILVANPNHSVQPNSGNCMILPDVNAVTILDDATCLTGPDPDSQPVTALTKGQVVRVLGLSLDEAWWNLANPTDPSSACWAPRDLCFFHGDLATVPLLEPTN
jgi:serine/threonine protein kinase